MNENSNIQTIKNAYAAFGRGDIPAILAELDPEVEWVISGQAFIPQGGTYRGPAGVGRFFQILSENADIRRFEPREFFAQGERVLVLGSYSGLTKPTGKPFESDWLMSFTFRGGKIAGFRELNDSAAIAASYEA